jgi:uncharacterized protein (TIGR03437 family)
LGANSVFVTKYSADGAVLYSALISGEASNTAVGIAVDPDQSAYVLGYTDSLQFPVTPGALVPTLDSGSYTGFLMKLSANASVAYATYLGESYANPGAILVGRDDQPVIAGSGSAPGLPPPPEGAIPDFLIKLDPAGSQVVMAANLPGDGEFGPSALAMDGSGNLLVGGSTNDPNFSITPGAYSSAAPVLPCEGLGQLESYSGYGAFIMKLNATNWTPIYTALLPCGGQPKAIAVDADGATVASLGLGAGFALRSPLIAGPACINGNASSGLAKLSPDGATLEFATYLEGCQPPALALARNGSIYAGITRPVTVRKPSSMTVGSVLHFSVAPAPGPSLDGIANSFSGDPTAVVGGGLYTLAVKGLEPPVIDLGLNSTQDLPLSLGGVQVQFDGVPAAILRTSPGQVVVAVPQNLPLRVGSRNVAGTQRRGNELPFTSVQVFYNGTASEPVWMPVAQQLPGLLTRDFPNFQSSIYTSFPDGSVRNQDGTLNDASHPAVAGSTVTFFVTGMGVANAPFASGAIAPSAIALSVSPEYASWAHFSGINAFTYPPEIFSTVPGFVSALEQVSIQVPDSLQNLGGTAAGNGVERVPFYLTPYPPTVPPGDVPPPTSIIGVYAK